LALSKLYLCCFTALRTSGFEMLVQSGWTKWSASYYLGIVLLRIWVSVPQDIAFESHPGVPGIKFQLPALTHFVSLPITKFHKKHSIQVNGFYYSNRLLLRFFN
jgi:hypothetical protein